MLITSVGSVPAPRVVLLHPGLLHFHPTRFANRFIVVFLKSSLITSFLPIIIIHTFIIYITVSYTLHIFSYEDSIKTPCHIYLDAYFQPFSPLYITLSSPDDEKKLLQLYFVALLDTVPPTVP